MLILKFSKELFYLVSTIQIALLVSSLYSSRETGQYLLWGPISQAPTWITLAGVCLASLMVLICCPQHGEFYSRGSLLPLTRSSVSSLSVPSGLCSQASIGPPWHLWRQNIIEAAENLPSYQDSISQECLAVVGSSPTWRTKQPEVSVAKWFSIMFWCWRICLKSFIFWWYFLPKLTELLTKETTRPQGTHVTQGKGLQGERFLQFLYSL